MALTFPVYVSNNIAKETANHLLDKMADYAEKEGTSLQDKARLSAEEVKGMGGPLAYQAFYKMAHAAMQSYEKAGGKVTQDNLRDPTLRGHIIRTIALVDKDNDNILEVGEVRTSSSDRAAVMLAAAEQRQRLQAFAKGDFGDKVTQAKEMAQQDGFDIDQAVTQIAQA